MSDRLEGFVVGGTGGVWRVVTDAGETVEAPLRGRLKKSNTGKRSDGSIRRNTVAAAADVLKLTVGDRVVLERDTRDSGWAIGEILPRRSVLARRAPGGGKGERLIAANVDQVIVMFAAAKPEPHPRMLDRFLVIAEANGIGARVVINKVDLADEAETRARFADYEVAGYPVHFISVKQARGVGEIADGLAGIVSVICGPSGVGKSSLLNALAPGLGLRVAEISESVNTGRHTTVGAFLFPLGDGGAVVDTPGLREIGLWEFPIEHLDWCYPELREPASRCRFADCAHIDEPECQVRAEVESGAVSRSRYESYLKLRGEIAEQRAEF